MTDTEHPDHVRITFDDLPLRAVSGQSAGAALTAAGIRSWRNTRKHGRPRGLFCGIGLCFDCLIIVDGIPDQRACLVSVRDGMRLESGPKQHQEVDDD